MIPLVAELRARLGNRAEAAQAVHLGATSQDILDTALMLVALEGSGVVLADLADCAASVAALAREHRATPMAGSHAAATGSADDVRRAGGRVGRPDWTAAARAARRGTRVTACAARRCCGHPRDIAPARARASWPRSRTSSISRSHPVSGTPTEARSPNWRARIGHGGGRDREARHRHRAARRSPNWVSLPRPLRAGRLPWRTNRTRSPRSLLGQPRCRHRGSSRRCSRRPRPSCSAARGWHAEWPALIALLRSVGGAASRLRASLSGLSVDATAMGRNVAPLETVLDIADLGHAVDLVERYLERRRP